MMRKNMNSTPATTNQGVAVTANVMVTLVGEEAERFLAYKDKEFLRANAEAGRKLMMERLAQLESASPAA
jgi:hypothetical protein